MQKTKSATESFDQVIVSPIPAKNYRRIFRDEALALSRISPRAVAQQILAQWLVIVLVFAVCIYITPQLLIVIEETNGTLAVVGLCCLLASLFAVGAVVIACKQHALGSIMHDATHYRLLETKQNNDLVSDLFCAFPIGMLTASYRRGHLPHHAFTNKALDPYWARLSQDEAYVFPMVRNKLRKLLIRDALGLNLQNWWPILRAWTGWAFILRDPEGYLTPTDRRRFTMFWAIATIAMIVSGWWPYFLGLWVLPLLTLNLAFTRLRIIAEHSLDVSDNEITRTRHVDGTWFERHAIGPLNINFHIAHHLFPMVPFYNLPKMHQILLTDQDFCRDAELWPSYLGRNGIIASLLTDGEFIEREKIEI